MTEDFSIKRDLHAVQWKETLWYNLVRAAAAGALCGVLLMITQGAFSPALLLTPISWPLAYLLIFMPIGFLFLFLSGVGVPFAGLIPSAFSLVFVAIGDPIVWALKKRFPGIVPVDQPPIFSPRLLIFILDQSAER